MTAETQLLCDVKIIIINRHTLNLERINSLMDGVSWRRVTNAFDVVVRKYVNYRERLSQKARRRHMCNKLIGVVVRKSGVDFHLCSGRDFN